MESLYRKYRPQTFEQVVGQSHVVSTLERAVTEGRTSHAYLFCGPRGTGKTTMARIVAKALMCEQGAGHLPDGTCEECQLIAAGEHPDVYELDAASRTGVDNVREEIISRVDYAPVRGRYKVYIIDEVHMLTPAAFNALLKTLEEPPEHVVFIMCTTDPQKILATILSRVQRFDFHSIAPNEMHDHLIEVCNSEGFTYDDEALQIVVRHARGGMRDALSALEQLSVFGAGHIGADSARDLLGETGGSALAGVSRSLAERDVPALFSGVADLVSNGGDLLQFTRELAARVRNAYVVSIAGAKPGVIDVPEGELAELSEEAAAYGSSDRLARVLSVLGDAANDMRTAPNQRLVLEIALTRCARPESDLTLESLAERIERLERGGVVAAAPAQTGGAAMPAPAPAPAAPAPSAPAAAPAPSAASAPAAAAPSPSAPSNNGSFVPPKLVLPGKRRPGVASTADSAATAPAAAPAAPKDSPVAAPAPKPAAPAVAASPQPAPAAAPSGAKPAAAAPTSVAPAASAAQPAAAPAPSAPSADAGALQRAWKQISQAVRASNPSFGSLLLNAEADSDDGTTLTLSFPAGSAFAMKMLGRQDVRSAVDAAVVSVLGPRQLATTERAAAPAAPSRPASGGLNIPEAPQPAASAPAPAVASPAPAAASQASAAAPAPKAAPAPQPAAASSAPAAAAPSSSPAQPSATPAPAAAAPAPEPAPASSPAEGPEASADEPPYDDYVPYDEAGGGSGDLPPIDVPDELDVDAEAAEPAVPASANDAPAPKTAAANLTVPDAADTDASAPFTGGAEELRSLAMGVWGAGVNVSVVSDDSE